MTTKATTAVIADDAVTTVKIVDNAITTDKILNDAVSRAKLKDEVSLLVINAAGSTVKTIYGAGS